MWNPLIEGWPRTLAAAVTIVVAGALGWLPARRWPGTRAVAAAGILTAAAYIAASWLGRLVSVHTSWDDTWAMLQHVGVVALAAGAAVLLVTKGGRSSGPPPPSG